MNTKKSEDQNIQYIKSACSIVLNLVHYIKEKIVMIMITRG